MLKRQYIQRKSHNRSSYGFQTPYLEISESKCYKKIRDSAIQNSKWKQYPKSNYKMVDKYTPTKKSSNTSYYYHDQFLKKNQKLTVHNSNSQASKNTNRQYQLVQKLNLLKRQFSGIPNWQQYAKSILFQKDKNYQMSHTSHQKVRSYEFLNTEQTYPYQNQQDSSKLLDSNLSFKIKQTSSVHQSENKARQKSKERSITNQRYSVNQFKLCDRNQERQKKDNEVNQRINLIQQRIKKCQQNKRKLGFDFEKSAYLDDKLRKHSKSISALSVSQSYTKLSKKQYNHQLSGSFKKSYQQEQKSLSKPPKYSVNKDILKQNKVVCFSPKFNNLNQQSNQYSHSFQFPQKKVSNNKNKSFNCKQKKSTDFSLYEDWQNQAQRNCNRRISINEFQYKNYQKQKSNFQIKSLVSNLTNQVKLDQNLRNAKLWLQYQKDPKKYNKLQSLLQIEQINLSIDQVQQLFQLLEEQENPFFSIKSYNSNLDQVVSHFILSEENWNKKLYRKFDREKLYDEYFTSSLIDMDKKGYIILQDFVRFMNMQTGTFFRNRDLHSTFKRLTDSDRLRFEEFINIICH